MNIQGLKLDTSTNDLVVIDGTLALVSDDDVIGRNLKTRLQMLRGEWVLDNTYGFEYSVIFANRVLDLQLIETALKNYILDTNGITSITTFKLDYIKQNSRLLTLNFSVLTIYHTEITVGGLTIG